VRRGKSATAKFDLRPKETSIEITVSGVDKASGPVAVALRGDPKSLRYVSDAPKWLYLKQGTYTLVVGHGDRLFERLFEVRSFDAMRMPLDLNRQDFHRLARRGQRLSRVTTARGERARARRPDQGRR
jgi:hypothetical protein